MNHEEKAPDSILDEAIRNVRDEEIDPAAVNAAAARVWARISAESAEGEDTIRTCADFRALIPAWREGRLAEARRLLFEDHTHECPACRKALEAARNPKVVSIAAPRLRSWNMRRWAIAAGLVAAAGLTAMVSLNYFQAAPAGSRATVQALDGALYKVSDPASAQMALAAPIGENELVRTAKASGAVLRLRDGSLVEMGERTDLSVSERSAGTTIRLRAGRIIVQAAKQRSRHLYVATEDCLVSVTGTVFSVNAGMKGSRVSVVEGEVRVAQGGQTSVLHPGDQLATSPAVEPVPVRDEIAWSRDVDRYIALMNDVTVLRKKLEAIPAPALRYSSRLLGLVPAGSILYAAIPNLGPTLGEAQQVLSQQLAQSQELREWWAQHSKSSTADPPFNEVFQRIQAFSGYLGPEVVIAMSQDAAGKQQPLLLAEVTRSGFRDFVESELQKADPQRRGLLIVEDPAALVAQPQQVEAVLFLSGGIAALSPNLGQLQSVAAALRTGDSGFARTPLGTQVADAYRAGAGWLLCADLHSLVVRAQTSKETANLQRSGFGDVRYLVVQRKDVQGQTENRAVLTFSDVRHGIASWLAAPAPMRALEFVSPDAHLATAVVVKTPSAAVEELFAMLQSANPGFANELSDFQSKTGLDVRADLVRPLGGDMAFAMDGPVLPKPSWKLIVEVYDPARLEQSIEKLVAVANGMMSPGATPLRLVPETVGGRTFYALSGGKTGFEVHYTFADGYLVAGPSRELVATAVQARQAGYTLPRSSNFLALVPRDGHTNSSALVYHSLGSIVGPLAEGLKLGAKLTPEQQQKLDAVAASAAPSLVLAYAAQDRIELASAGSFFGVNLENFLPLPGAKTAGRRTHGPPLARSHRH